MTMDAPQRGNQDQVIKSLIFALHAIKVAKISRKPTMTCSTCVFDFVWLGQLKCFESALTYLYSYRLTLAIWREQERSLLNTLKCPCLEDSRVVEGSNQNLKMQMQTG